MLETRFIDKFAADSGTFSELETDSVCSYNTVPQNIHTVS